MGPHICFFQVHNNQIDSKEILNILFFNIIIIQAFQILEFWKEEIEEFKPFQKRLIYAVLARQTILKKFVVCKCSEKIECEVPQLSWLERDANNVKVVSSTLTGTTSFLLLFSSDNICSAHEQILLNQIFCDIEKVFFHFQKK